MTLSVIYVALIARMTRTSVLEVLSEDYIRTARAKGQTERMVLFRHALRNAAVPIVTVIGLGVALLIGGVVVTESVFTIPGLGRLTVDAVLARDYPTIQAVILLFSFVYVMINLAVDMLYTVLDPKDSLLMVDATIIEPVLPASPGKPSAAFRSLRHNPSVMFGATVIGIVLLMGRSRRGSVPSTRPRLIRLGATRFPARNSTAHRHRRAHQDDRAVRNGRTGARRL